MFIDESGNRYGRLIVADRADHARSDAYWRCLCDCGSESVVAGSDLRSGSTQSCGCLHRELSAARIAERNTTHGHRGPRTPTYRAWGSMKERCINPNHHAFDLYGGRGIRVCDRWLTFENFLADMGERPADPAEWTGRRAYWSIDRIDPDGNYEPSNCRWATPLEQRRNRRDS